MNFPEFSICNNEDIINDVIGGCLDHEKCGFSFFLSGPCIVFFFSREMPRSLSLTVGPLPHRFPFFRPVQFFFKDQEKLPKD